VTRRAHARESSVSSNQRSAPASVRMSRCANVGQSGASTIEGGSAMSLAVTTTAFSPGGAIPKGYTCDGLIPRLTCHGRSSCRSPIVRVDCRRPRCPVGTWTHCSSGISGAKLGLPNGVPKVETLDDGTRQGRNDFRRIGYGGPCPPPGKPHRYFFKVYALDAKLDLRAGANRDELERR